MPVYATMRKDPREEVHGCGRAYRAVTTALFALKVRVARSG